MILIKAIYSFATDGQLPHRLEANTHKESTTSPHPPVRARSSQPKRQNLTTRNKESDQSESVY